MWVAEVTQAAVPTIGRFWGFLQTNTGKKVFASAVLIGTLLQTTLENVKSMDSLMRQVL